MIELRKYVQSKDLLIVAHRGASGNAPENTIPAFKNALDIGINMVETDVQLTSDGYVIAFHDEIITRTSDGCGCLNCMDLQSVKMLDAGAWFSDKFAGEKIPLLSELLDLIDDKAYIIIEIKSLPKENCKQCIEYILNEVYNKHYEKYTVFASFDHNIIKMIKNINPQLYTAVIKIPDDNTLPSVLKLQTKCDGFICSVDEINQEIVDNANTNGIIVGLYDVDSTELFDKAMRYKIKAVATNFPEEIMNYTNKIHLDAK